MNTRDKHMVQKNRHMRAYRTIAKFSGLPVEEVTAELEKRIKHSPSEVSYSVQSNTWHTLEPISH